MTDGADTLRVGARSDLRAIADRLAQVGAPQAPLYAAAAEGAIALLTLSVPATPWPTMTLATIKRPTVVVLGGDPGWNEPSFGPDRWRCAKKMRAWAAGGIIHGAEGRSEHYAEGAMLALLVGRVAIIETTSTLARSWSAFMEPVPCTGYLPAEGVHPCAPRVRH